MIRWLSRRIVALFALCGFCLVFACGEPKVTKVDFGNLVVSGKVTYKGKPVPFGMVVLYTMSGNMNLETGVHTPAAIAPIGSDGSYQFIRAPSGPVQFCIVTDLTAAPHTLHAGRMSGVPTSPGKSGPQPPLPGEEIHIPINPAAEKLSDEEKTILLEIDKKYGKFGVPSLHYVLPPNTERLSHNFELD